MFTVRMEYLILETEQDLKKIMTNCFSIIFYIYWCCKSGIYKTSWLYLNILTLTNDFQCNV